jgi:hypothetical protein
MYHLALFSIGIIFLMKLTFDFLNDDLYLVPAHKRNLLVLLATLNIINITFEDRFIVKWTNQDQLKL